MPTVYHKQELTDVIYGAGFYGGGGGGATIEGTTLLDTLGDDVKMPLYTIDEMEDTDAEGRTVVSAMVAALGSPVETKGMLFDKESINAVNAMRTAAAQDGKTLRYIYSGEQGGGNTMLPFYAAIQLGLDVLDLDGNGRAVPEMNTGLLPIHDIPTSPMVLATGKGDVLVARTEDPLDSLACERIARQMSIAYTGVGLCAWLAGKSDHKKASALYQISRAQRLGAALREVYGFEDLLASIQLLLGSSLRHWAVGKIVDIRIDSAGGFDNGITTIEGESGRQYRILFQNENLVLYEPDGEALTTVPDIISLVSLSKDERGYYAPLSNSETHVNQDVLIVASKADPKWHEPDGRGYSCWKQVLIDAGYCDVRPQV